MTDGLITALKSGDHEELRHGASQRSSGSNPLIPKLGQHTGYHMVEVVTVERPTARVIRVKGYSDTAHTRRDQHGVAHRALHRPAIDCDHLECMAVQMHRMRHHRVVDQLDLDALSLAPHQRRHPWPVLTVHGPRIGLHAARESDRVNDISGTRRQRFKCRKLRFERIVDGRSSLRAARDPRDWRSWRGDDDPGLPTIAFQSGKDRKRASSW